MNIQASTRVLEHSHVGVAYGDCPGVIVGSPGRRHPGCGDRVYQAEVLTYGGPQPGDPTSWDWPWNPPDEPEIGPGEMVTQEHLGYTQPAMPRGAGNGGERWQQRRD